MTRILVVDDEPNIAQPICHHLKRQGFQTEIAYNGKKALSKIRASVPDLLITDVMMPEMDGVELIMAIRQEPDWSGLPVIVMVARGPTDPFRIYIRDQEMLIPKPFPPHWLADSIKMANELNDGLTYADLDADLMHLGFVRNEEANELAYIYPASNATLTFRSQHSSTDAIQRIDLIAAGTLVSSSCDITVNDFHRQLRVF